MVFQSTRAERRAWIHQLFHPLTHIQTDALKKHAVWVLQRFVWMLQNARVLGPSCRFSVTGRALSQTSDPLFSVRISLLKCIENVLRGTKHFFNSARYTHPSNRIRKAIPTTVCVQSRRGLRLRWRCGDCGNRLEFRAKTV